MSLQYETLFLKTKKQKIKIWKRKLLYICCNSVDMLLFYGYTVKEYLLLIWALAFTCEECMELSKKASHFEAEKGKIDQRLCRNIEQQFGQGKQQHLMKKHCSSCEDPKNNRYWQHQPPPHWQGWRHQNSPFKDGFKSRIPQDANHSSALRIGRPD